MSNLFIKIIELSKNNEEEKIESLLEGKLKYDPNNIELMLRLAILELRSPFHNEEKSIRILEKMLDIENNNPIALLILGCIYECYELSGINYELVNKLNSLITSDCKINSMLRYVASWFYERNHDVMNQEKCLKDSINFYDGHVSNYVDLARLYYKEGKKVEAKELIRNALKNVKKIYYDDFLGYDPTDVNQFLNEEINGTYLTSEHLEEIKKEFE